ncbi:NADPH:adrenodoxin oxidoreductase, mitochondrial-like isoform X1 [Centruroides sculpturatus]|uniref:NADPH:adrenodoxin oxidoreductase, mitochondrial-like isoform X1 n=1 Tax=Centruroides sculpturatus TaxID=218467 RepID=UPI000C6D02F4|nr:NADPH:adrenodoxin oxidoreductase, mitochondrial-like isoform X1 [Centruroides sculpturatus]
MFRMLIKSSFLSKLIQSKRYLCTVKQLKVCIVGSGPAGFYTAQQILKHPLAVVDLYEKLPVPFGLVRFGVAPDHPEVKNVINTFTKTAANERFSFFGNVNVGKDITLSDLRSAYHAVIMCYGAEKDLHLGIPGENTPNVIAARKFVGWYNGLPDESNLSVDLNCDTAIVIGQGNVALDVARILLMPVELLKKTDITQNALNALSKSKIKRVVLVGRRGPLQVAFTIKELREMTKLPGCCALLEENDFRSLKDMIPTLPRPRQRLTELMVKTCENSKSVDVRLEMKQWELKFLRTPLEIIPSDNGNGVKSIVFGINKLEGSYDKPKIILTEEKETIDCGLILRSIGYRSLSIDPELPFDKEKGIIPNINGRVVGTNDLYCSGWVRTGPKGVILHTMTDSFQTGKAVTEDFESGRLSPETKLGRNHVLNLLRNKGITPVTFNDWEKIDFVEQEAGRMCNKPREKLLSTHEMLSVAQQKS